MSKVVDFYEKVVKSIGLDVNSNGVISVDGTDVLVDNKPLVLPSKENIDTLVAKNDDGTLTITKVLFNPLSENALKAFGVIGVIVFLIISGYLFGFDNKPLAVFIKKKSKSLFIPWFIIGSGV